MRFMFNLLTVFAFWMFALFGSLVIVVALVACLGSIGFLFGVILSAFWSLAIFFDEREYFREMRDRMVRR